MDGHIATKEIQYRWTSKLGSVGKNKPMYFSGKKNIVIAKYLMCYNVQTMGMRLVYMKLKILTGIAKEPTLLLVYY